MCIHLAVKQVEVLQNALRLAQRITHYNRGQSVMQIAAPPLVYILKYLYLWFPLVHGHPKSTFRYKMVAFYRLEWG